jgi:hypothetical protein
MLYTSLKRHAVLTKSVYSFPFSWARAVCNICEIHISFSHSHKLAILPCSQLQQFSSTFSQCIWYTNHIKDIQFPSIESVDEFLFSYTCATWTLTPPPLYQHPNLSKQSYHETYKWSSKSRMKALVKLQAL